jgi:hypothetical protein
VSPQRPTLRVIGRRVDPEDHCLRDFLTRADQTEFVTSSLTIRSRLSR